MKEFEEQWMNKLYLGLKKLNREDIYNRLIKSKNELSRVEWSAELIKKMKKDLTSEEIIGVMTGCACFFPNENLEHLKDEYAITGNIEQVHTKLQELFEVFIRKYKNLNDKDIEFLITNGWGMAGKLEEDRIIAIKIPKEYQEYFQTDDKRKKAYYYCHCPRVRDALKNSDKPVDMNYCYCGAGFYKAIWEYILQKQVKVEVLESVMKGDDLCKIAIYYR